MKLTPLDDFFRCCPRVALAFSGGTDSAYLLYAAQAAGAEVRAYFLKTPLQPAFELADAHRLAEKLDVSMTVLEVDILKNTSVSANPPDRCYHCKMTLFTGLCCRAAADGFPLVIDGTNASDDAGDRPGMRALRELGVRSPLRECGITKTEVRRLSREAGLFTWDKPAYACLATRIPAGEAITAEKLARVEGAEAALTEMGFRDFRVRLLGDCARLQLPAAYMAEAISRREELRNALAPWFKAVLLDLRDRP